MDDETEKERVNDIPLEIKAVLGKEENGLAGFPETVRR